MFFVYFIGENAYTKTKVMRAHYFTPFAQKWSADSKYIPYLCHARANLRVTDRIIRLRSPPAVGGFMSRLHWFSAARRRDI